ncbi:sugar phosphate isomerase/epimerase family protein [Sphingobium phenoxybenzoativorans]|uniref:sugar phosphate isomerase/epimerase family protein n=1 Tax=Sphingobium phenoxybenzoativorans TaxID=1592790 RepID=UPI000872B58D|nr:TIM barrel protein [Sphingobium phenoxybenzoativorans]
MARANPLSMCAGIMPEATPVQLVESAAYGGFDYSGMWFEPDQWTAATTREVKAAIAATGVPLLDIEVVWIQPGPPNPDHLRLIDIGMELGALNVLCVSSDPDMGATRDKLALLMEHGAAGGIRVNLEFGLFSEIRTIGEACRMLREINSPSAGLLIDALHWTRHGGTLEEIAAVPRKWLSYIQLCDAPAVGADPADPDAILVEALDGRMPMGHGGLDLHGIMSLMPEGIPVAVEERSLRLREDFPDLKARAAELARTSRAWLEVHGAQISA